MCLLEIKKKGVMRNMIAGIAGNQNERNSFMEEIKMKESIYKSYEELPMVL